MWSDATKEKREEVAEQMKTRYFPKIDYEAVLETNTNYVQNAIADLGVLILAKEAPYAKMWMTLTNGVLTLKNYDEHEGVVESEIAFNEVKNKKKGFMNSYNFGKLSDAINPSISETVIIQTGQDMPMHVHYWLGEEKASHIAHLIAPILDMDDLKAQLDEKEAFEKIPKEEDT
jgi:hypothetical protein